MTWTYTGNPADSDKDQVRFLIGDTNAVDPLIADEEITFAISNPSTLNLAGALCLRTLANKFSRLVTRKIGDLGVNCSDMAKAFADRANELDPSGVTKASLLALPSFGGLSLAGKEILDSDTDAVQPRFSRDMNDHPGGYPDGPDDKLVR